MNASSNVLMYSLMVGVGLIAVLAILGGFYIAIRERSLTHTERMKALELGRELPDGAAVARIKAAFGHKGGSDDDEGGSSARKCFSTALWVAFWGFGAAAMHGGVGLNAGVAYAIAAA